MKMRKTHYSPGVIVLWFYLCSDFEHNSYLESLRRHNRRTLGVTLFFFLEFSAKVLNVKFVLMCCDFLYNVSVL